MPDRARWMSRQVWQVSPPAPSRKDGGFAVAGEESGVMLRGFRLPREGRAVSPDAWCVTRRASSLTPRASQSHITLSRAMSSLDIWKSTARTY